MHVVYVYKVFAFALHIVFACNIARYAQMSKDNSTPTTISPSYRLSLSCCLIYGEQSIRRNKKEIASCLSSLVLNTNANTVIMVKRKVDYA